MCSSFHAVRLSCSCRVAVVSLSPLFIFWAFPSLDSAQRRFACILLLVVGLSAPTTHASKASSPFAPGPPSSSYIVLVRSMKQTLDRSNGLIRASMIKLRYSSKRLFKRISSSSSSKAASARGSGGDGGHGNAVVGGGAGEIEWEVRPGGMLVQKRDGGRREEVIMVRVSTGFSCHHVSIGATCTFGELKAMLSMVTGLEPREQRLLFRGKERDDTDHLHMVGVGDKGKVLLLEDPALKDLKLRATRAAAQVVQSARQPFIQV